MPKIRKSAEGRISGILRFFRSYITKGRQSGQDFKGHAGLLTGHYVEGDKVCAERDKAYAQLSAVKREMAIQRYIYGMSKKASLAEKFGFPSWKSFL